MHFPSKYIYIMKMCIENAFLWWEFLFLGTIELILHNMDGLVQDKCNSSALAMELHFSCTNPSICHSNTCLMIAWKSGQKFSVCIYIYIYISWVTSHIENHGPYYIVCTVLDVPLVHIGGLMWHGRQPLRWNPTRSLSMLLAICADKSDVSTHCSLVMQ